MHIVPERDHGMVVWARMSMKEPVWAAIILSTKKIDLDYKETEGKSWVWWLEANNMSHLKFSLIYEFSSSYSIFSQNLVGQRKRGLIEAIEILAYQFNVDLSKNLVRDDFLIYWAGENIIEKTKNQIGKSKRGDELYIPPEILNRLQAIKLKNIQNSITMVVQESSKRLTDNNKRKPIKLKRKCHYCIACHSPLYDQKRHHPLFVGYVCTTCYLYMETYVLTICKDRVNKACCICFDILENNSILCNFCIRIFCSECLKINCGELGYSTILETKKWNCLACEDQSKSVTSIMQRRSIKEQLTNVYNLFGPPKAPASIKKFKIPELKVLALNDHQNLVTTILNTLDQPFKVIDSQAYDDFFLNTKGIENDVLATCHDVDLLVQYYPNGRNYDKEYFNKYGAVEELLKFVLLLNQIRNHKSRTTRKLFWAFECGASLTYSDRNKISLFCEKDPILIGMNVKDNSQRGRFIWTNIVMPEKTVDKFRDVNIFLQEVKKASDLKDEDNPWCYRSMSLILSCLIDNHIE